MRGSKGFTSRYWGVHAIDHIASRVNASRDTIYSLPGARQSRAKTEAEGGLLAHLSANCDLLQTPRNRAGRLCHITGCKFWKSY